MFPCSRILLADTYLTKRRLSIKGGEKPAPRGQKTTPLPLCPPVLSLFSIGDFMANLWVRFLRRIELALIHSER